MTNCEAPVSHIQINDQQECSTCHQSEFAKATAPLHMGMISQTCEECHAQEYWAPARGSDHSWALDGAHTSTPCGDCHVGEPTVYETTPTECVDCHADAAREVVAPSHEEFSTTCLDCHTTEAWTPATLEHEWPLEGAHADAECGSCHVGDPPVYEGTPETCVGCHEGELAEVVEPSHEEFSTDCQDCHTVEAFRPALFPDHEWPLEGAHEETVCADCHGDPPEYEGTVDTCVGCHSADRDAAEEPPHQGLSDDCSSCHGVVAWDDALFEHSETFALEGGHGEASCADCHTGSPPQYEGLAADCVSCHQEDLDGVVEPPHDGFSRDCSSCHGVTTWDEADFVHTDSFPLEGGHGFPECQDCHTGSPTVFEGLSRDCVGCHQQDYDGALFPGHDAFPTTCQDCHTIEAWTPASGGHPENRFPTRGDHNYACNECHNPSLGPMGQGNADCVGCHDGEHTLARMDREHQGEVRNYPTGPNRSQNFCVDCHPDGRE